MSLSVEPGEQAWTVTVDSQTIDLLSGMRHAVRIAPQYLLANAAGSIRARSAGRCQRPPRTLEAPKPAEVIAAFSRSVCRVLRRRSPAEPPASRKSFGCLAIALEAAPQND